MGAILFLCVAPSRSFIAPACTKSLPNPLFSSSRSGRIDKIGDYEATDVRLGASFARPSVTEVSPSLEYERRRLSQTVLSHCVTVCIHTLPLPMSMSLRVRGVDLASYGQKG